MAVLKLVVLVCTLIYPALSRPAIGGAYNPVYNTYNSGYNAGYHTGYNTGYTPGDTFDPHPRYSYDYRVAEPRTGDYKSAQESRDGDAVRGSYSVAEPDGSLLTVRYAADDAHGYTAVVERSGHGGTVVNTYPGPAPLPVAPTYSGAPIYSGAPLAPVPTAYVPPVRPLAVTPLPLTAPVHHRGFSGNYGTTSTSFSGPHASYHY